MLMIWRAKLLFVSMNFRCIPDLRLQLVWKFHRVGSHVCILTTAGIPRQATRSRPQGPVQSLHIISTIDGRHLFFPNSIYRVHPVKEDCFRQDLQD